MIKEIYHRVYSRTEDGKQGEYEVSEKISGLLQKHTNQLIEKAELEEILSEVAGVGLEAGFKMGIQFGAQMLAEIMV